MPIAISGGRDGGGRRTSTSPSPFPGARTARWLFAALAIAGCGAMESSSEPEAKPPPCLIQFGEFPPAACGFLVGTVRDSFGQPLAGRVFRADSFYAGGGFIFASSSETADSAGHLEIVVVRVPDRHPTPDPDTATVPLLLYLNAREAKALAPARARVYVQIEFAPIGRVVDTTFASPWFPIVANELAPTPDRLSGEPGR